MTIFTAHSHLRRQSYEWKHAVMCEITQKFNLSFRFFTLFAFWPWASGGAEQLLLSTSVGPPHPKTSWLRLDEVVWCSIPSLVKQPLQSLGVVFGVIVLLGKKITDGSNERKENGMASSCRMLWECNSWYLKLVTWRNVSSAAQVAPGFLRGHSQKITHLDASPQFCFLCCGKLQLVAIISTCVSCTCSAWCLLVSLGILATEAESKVVEACAACSYWNWSPCIFLPLHD